MALIRWSPRVAGPRDLFRMNDEFDRMIDTMFTRGALRGDVDGFTPPVDIEENTESFVVRADLPGVSQKDVKVTVMGDTLTIRGERTHEKKENGGSLHRYERVQGVFERSFSLGTPVRNDKVKATFKDGVLEIVIPKAEEARERVVEIQSS